MKNNPSNLSFNEAVRIANTAVQSLNRKKQKANICVVNACGQTIVRYRMDETRAFTDNVAFLKARLSAYTGMRTRHLRDEFKKPEGELTPALLGIKEKDLVLWAGGVPIYTKGKKRILLGAIGISNLSEDEDEANAIVAVEALEYAADRR